MDFLVCCVSVCWGIALILFCMRLWLDRAETILKGLEAEDGKKPDAPAVSAAAEEVQSNLFSSSIIDELAHADVMGMTPIEAMNMLFRLSKEAKEGR